MSDGDFHSDAAAAHDRAWTTLEDAANKVASRSRRYSLQQVCAQLNIDGLWDHAHGRCGGGGCTGWTPDQTVMVESP